MSKTFLALALASLLTACGQESATTTSSQVVNPITSRIDGTFKSDDGKHTLTFTSDGRVKTVVFDQPAETSYLVEGSAVSFKFPDGLPLTYSIKSDGSLVSPMGTRYTKL